MISENGDYGGIYIVGGKGKGGFGGSQKAQESPSAVLGI